MDEPAWSGLSDQTMAPELSDEHGSALTASEAFRASEVFTGWSGASARPWHGFQKFQNFDSFRIELRVEAGGEQDDEDREVAGEGREEGEKPADAFDDGFSD
ncbi:MAG: hypothetical protein QM762_22035 [Chryseolinea sp.]